MDTRSLVLLATFAITSAAFAGCVEAPAFLSAEVEATAFDAREVADEAAAAWNPKAKLASVMTIELTNSTDARVPADPEVGNGRAMAWWFVYVALSDEAMDVRAYRVADGVATEESDAEVLGAAAAAQWDENGMEVIRDWQVDSDAAIAAAKTDDRFRLAAQGFNATVVSGVARHADMHEHDDEAAARGGEGDASAHAMGSAARTAWWIVAGSVDGIVVALVDATSGALLEVDELDMGFVMPKVDFSSAGVDSFVPAPIHIEDEGELEDEPAEYPFSTVGPVAGEMSFATTGGGLARSASWVILDEEGDAVAGPRGFAREEEDFDVELDEGGEYTLVVYERSWLPLPEITGPVGYEFVLHLDPVAS